MKTKAEVVRELEVLYDQALDAQEKSKTVDSYNITMAQADAYHLALSLVIELPD